MLTPQEQALIAELRANARPTGEDDARRKSDLRRGQRRLLAIIDRLTGAEAMQACRLLVKWHGNVFITGQALRLENGYPVDVTDLNEAARLAEHALTGAPPCPKQPSSLGCLELMKLQGFGADEIARELLCEDCPPHGYPTDKTRCRECPRRRKEPGHAQTDSVDL